MTFEHQPTRRGTDVAFRPLRADDFDALFAVASDPLVRKLHPIKNRCTDGAGRASFLYRCRAGDIRQAGIPDTD